MMILPVGNLHSTDIERLTKSTTMWREINQVHNNNHASLVPIRKTRVDDLKQRDTHEVI